MKRFSVLIVLFVLLASILGSTGCGASDEALIKGEFDLEYPGYSDIKVLNRAGEGTGISPMILTLQVTMESYPDSVVCEGELFYFHSDPSYREMRWYTLEAIGHWLLVEKARYHLKYAVYPYDWPEPVALLLKRWIEKGFINIDDITNPGMRRQIDYFMDPANVPTHFNNAGLFDTTNMQTYDLAPELPDSEKTPVYLLRNDGIVELYLVAKGTWYEKSEELRQKGMILPTPIPKPEEGQK